jgi:hypothetical protein
MRTATLFLLLGGCGLTAATEGGSPGTSGATDPFRRVTPDELAPALDTAYLDCDGDGWLVVAEVAGRAASARGVVVRTTGAPLALELPLEKQETDPASPWVRFQLEIEDPAIPCDRADVATVVEAYDDAGKAIDCVAFGPGAADLAGGRLAGRLDGVNPGDWSRCKVR